MNFRLKIKNGSTDYRWDSKTNDYGTKNMDDIRNYETLPEALAEFLYAVEDCGTLSEDKITLTYLPSKKKDKK